ncbi:hypothetical protein EDB81DRAFT_64724 [Dactylonectria macrodidyma]|uniref:Uncharacterized protein n=1 Tax=Dactylonectria macrodidyma TaxID=307937 RepID=A0A9P9EMC9_9HYPO|nr:hypothetical protein EDB81DRAFT_64724 [Dactylonectria macrodidyma]
MIVCRSLMLASSVPGRVRCHLTSGARTESINEDGSSGVQQIHGQFAGFSACRRDRAVGEAPVVGEDHVRPDEGATMLPLRELATLARWVAA